MGGMIRQAGVVQHPGPAGVRGGGAAFPRPAAPDTFGHIMKHTVLLSGMLLAGAGLAGAPVWLEQPARRVTVVEGGGYFPVAIRLRSGEILAVLRGGAPHIGVKGRLEVVTSRDGGATWSAPQTVVDGPDDDRNPAFGQLSDGTIVLGYAIARGYDATGLRFTGDTRRDHIFDGVYVTRSGDGGRTWSKPERSPATFALAEKGAISPYGKIVQLADGTAVMAVYYEFYDGRGNQSYIFRSKDGGKTGRSHAAGRWLQRDRDRGARGRHDAGGAAHGERRPPGRAPFDRPGAHLERAGAGNRRPRAPRGPDPAEGRTRAADLRGA